MMTLTQKTGALFLTGTIFTVLLVAPEMVLAQAGGASGDQTLGSVADTVRTSMGDVAALITAAAYVAGIGFAMMGLLKLKAHKDNPTQVPLSQPLTLLIIAAGLVFMPSLIKTAGSTIWTGKEASGTTGGAGSGAEHSTFSDE